MPTPLKRNPVAILKPVEKENATGMTNSEMTADQRMYQYQPTATQGGQTISPVVAEKRNVNPIQPWSLRSLNTMSSQDKIGYSNIYSQNRGKWVGAAMDIAGTTYNTGTPTTGTTGVKPVSTVKTPTITPSPSNLTGTTPVKSVEETNRDAALEQLNSAEQVKLKYEQELQKRRREQELQSEKIVGKNIGEAMTDAETDFERNKKAQELQWNTEHKNAVDQMARNEANIAYRAWSEWNAVSQSAAAGRALRDELERWKTAIDNMVTINDLNVAQRADNYKRQMRDLTNQLNTQVSADIQKALVELWNLDAIGDLNSMEAIGKAQRDIYQRLGENYQNYVNTSYAMAQNIYAQASNDLNFYRQREAQVQDYQRNEQKYDEAITSKINDGYLYNANRERMTGANGEPIQVDIERPIQQIIDNQNGTHTLFYKDGTAEIKQTSTPPTQGAVDAYAQLINTGRINLWDVPTAMRQWVAQSLSKMKPYRDVKPTTIKLADGTEISGFVDTATMKYYDTQGNEVRPAYVQWDLSTVDFRSLSGKYPNEASLKNNNPAWITYNDRFAKTLTEAGIPFEKGTARPANEGGNYFMFPTVQAGLDSYNLLWSLPSYQNLTVQQALNRWWTGAVASNIDKTKKVSQLTEEEVEQLQIAQLKKESPWFYKEMVSLANRSQTESSGNMTPSQLKALAAYDGKNIEGLAKSLGVSNSQARAMYDEYSNDVGGKWYDLEKQLYDAIVAFEGGSKWVSDTEGLRIETRVKDFAKAGLSPNEAILKYKWMNISNPENQEKAFAYTTIGDNLWEWVKPKNYEMTVAKYINSGDQNWLDVYVNRLADQSVKKVYEGDAILSANYKIGNDRTNTLVGLIEKNRDKIGAFDGRVEDLLSKFKWTGDYQKLKTILQMSQADSRKYFAGSAVTETEMKALQDFIWGNTKMNPDNLITMLRTLQEDREGVYMSQRIGLLTPDFTRSTSSSTKVVANWKDLTPYFKK